MTTEKSHIFREYDIRGNAEQDLESELVTKIGEAFVLETGSKTVAVGRDGRLSSPRLFEALTRGLRRRGANVRDIGVGPSPLLYFAAHHLATDGSVMITGSHNPGEDNGLKMMRGKNSFFGPDIQALAARVAELDTASGPEGTMETIDISDAYLALLTESSRLGDKAVRFVVDAGNGAAGPLSLRAFRHLGFDPDPLFCDIDGRFPNHHPDPTLPENLAQLRERVLSTKADLGIAFDGDGDRLGAIDERGEIIWGDKLMILFSRALLLEHPGAAILGEVKCSATLFDDITKHGGRALFSKTGHSLIKTRMKTENALLAGEMSGHLFFRDRYLGYDDATYAAIRLLEIVAKSGKPLSELLADVPVTFATPELRFPCEERLKFEIVKRVVAHYKSTTHEVLDLDGARIHFGGGAWGLCRASNTQAVLVLRFEGRSIEERDRLHAEVLAVVKAAEAEARAG